MSKNKNYTEFYKKNEEVKADEPVQEVEEVTSEEIQEAEESSAEPEEVKEEKPEVIYHKAIVANANKVNFREQSNKDAKILAVLPAGANVRIIKRGLEWTEIEFDNKTGYMMTKFLKEVL